MSRRKGGRPTEETTGQPGQSDFDLLHRSYISLQKEMEYLSTLREVGLAISHSLDLDTTLEEVAVVLQGTLDVRRLTIYEWAKDDGHARPLIAKYGRDIIRRDRLKEESVSVSGTPIERALVDRTVVLENTGFSSEAYVPLVANDGPVGVMRLEDPNDGTPFSNEDLRLFHSLGGQVAIPIYNAQLYALAVTDGLTGLYVRRYLDLRLEEEFDQARRYGRVFSLMMLDIDHFKKFNDTHGHQTGDMVLKQVADLLRENTRKSDVCCRYGGEEMAVVLPETALNEAALLANKLCALVRDTLFEGMEQQELHVTTSIGVTQFEDGHEDPAQMVELADEALYRAKELGRNRVELHF